MAGEGAGTFEVTRFKRIAGVAGGLVDPRLEEQRSKILVAPNHIERDGTSRLLNLETANEQGADSSKYEVRAGEIIYCSLQAAMPNLNREALGEAPVWLPPLLEQQAITKHLAEANAYKNAQRHTDKQNARIEHDKALLRVMTAVMKDDTELFKQFMDNEGFRRWMTKVEMLGSASPPLNKTMAGR